MNERFFAPTADTSAWGWASSIRGYNADSGADVLGARVYQNPQVEIGWFELQTAAKPSQEAIVRDLPEHFMAFHWHGDTFEIPTGAIHIAQSQACRNQAFEYEGHVVGLQFHLEYSARSIEKMLVHCVGELIEAPFVQSRDQITEGLAHLRRASEVLDAILRSLLGLDGATS